MFVALGSHCCYEYCESNIVTLTGVAQGDGSDGVAGAPIYSDGSIEKDLPMEQLAELFNVNHFIISQVCVTD